MVRVELGGGGLRAVADEGAFLVVGEEGCFFEAGPEGFAFGGEGWERVEVGAEFDFALRFGCPLRIRAPEPARQRLGDALDEGQHGGAPEDALCLFLARLRQDRHVRVGVVAGNAEQPSCLRAFGKVVVARLRHDGGTPRASAISRAATWRADSCLAR